MRITAATDKNTVASVGETGLRPEASRSSVTRETIARNAAAPQAARLLATSPRAALRRSAQRWATRAPASVVTSALRVPLPGGAQADVTVRARRTGAATPMVDPATVREVLRKRLPSVVVVRTEKGLGSGYFIDATSYLQSLGADFQVPAGKMLILTNKHVVEGAGGPGKDQVDVDLFDKRTVKGEVLAVVDSVDAALVMIDRVGSFAPIPVGDRSALERGDPVLILGHPLGLNWSVTQGIISDPEREFPGIPVRVIQTDAPVNPGNSGGPMILLDREGRVIGTNSFKINRPGVENIAFAYHIDDQLNGVVQAWIERRRAKTTPVARVA
ncbi:MAG: serine protease [Deltaproteobacteria bacterium]|nr:serine protease [Deltaproteobacteria bacterium]